jgi:hypothetical protein
MPDLPWTSNTIAQLSMIGVCDTAQIVNTHHFEASEVIEAQLLNDQLAIEWGEALVDDWIAQLKDEYLGCHTGDYTLNMVRCQVIERPGTFRHKLVPVERPQSTGNTGGIGVAAEATQVAVVVKWKTPRAGKSSRGRSYLGPVPPVLMSSGRLATGNADSGKYLAYADAMIARYGALAGVEAAAYRLTIYSRPYNQGEYQYATRKTGTLTVESPEDYAGNSTNVTVAQVDPILRTQRRREVGVGS